MGFRDLFKSSRQKRIETAAHQMYQALLRGIKFEVPQTFSTDDDTVAAVLLLKKRHPDVTTTMLQSRGMLLARIPKQQAQSNAWQVLEANGYFPPNELDSAQVLDAHVDFVKNKTDVPLDAGARWADERAKEQGLVVEAAPVASEPTIEANEVKAPALG